MNCTSWFRRRFAVMAALMLASLLPSAARAALVYHTSTYEYNYGQLLSVDNILLPDNKLYTVTFTDSYNFHPVGSPYEIDVFPDGTSRSYVDANGQFQRPSSTFDPYQAARSLASVLVDGSAGAFGSNPALVRGCNLNALWGPYQYCEMFTQYGYEPFRNFNLARVYLYDYVNYSSDCDYGLCRDGLKDFGSAGYFNETDRDPTKPGGVFDNATWAVWTLSPAATTPPQTVPEPGTIALLGLAAAAACLGLTQRRRATGASRAI